MVIGTLPLSRHGQTGNGLSEPAPHVSDDRRAEMPQRTVMVVEDVACMRQALARLLESAGHSVRLAATVAEALRIADGSDTVVLDLCLPDGSGRTVLEAMRRQG